MDQRNKMMIAYVFMYITEASKYPNVETEEFACYLFGHGIEEVKRLFATAIHLTGISADDLTIVSLMVSNDADQATVLTHLKVAEFEEKAVFTPQDIDPTRTISNTVMNAFLTDLYQTTKSNSAASNKFDEIYAAQPIAV